eukprot:TRINITY_DN1840_c0_g1_i13.p2 TRINITY_DN1840_c0_g1~~TRINITY_DN1840_c0_g1_i13.p2  ORF type:complete len:115 (+),score=53.21 TRINITY_DN1840_c0_g1_i13:140-484(+)
MIRRPPRSTLSSSSAASDVYKRQLPTSADNINKLTAAAGIEVRNTVPILFSRFLEKKGMSALIAASSSAAAPAASAAAPAAGAVSYTHLRAHETPEHLVCRLLLEKKKKKIDKR